MWFHEKTNRKTTETGWVSVCFGSNRKKINCFKDTLIEICFLEIFSVCFGCFDTGSKHRNNPRKKFVWFRARNWKTTKTDWVSVRFGSSRKKMWLFRGHPTHRSSLPEKVQRLCMPLRSTYLKVEPGKSEESARILQESSLLLDLKGQSVGVFLPLFSMDPLYMGPTIWDYNDFNIFNRIREIIQIFHESLL